MLRQGTVTRHVILGQGRPGVNAPPGGFAAYKHARGTDALSQGDRHRVARWAAAGKGDMGDNCSGIVLMTVDVVASMVFESWSIYIRSTAVGTNKSH